MRVFLAGGSGAIGVPLDSSARRRRSRGDGADAFACERRCLRGLGATLAVADALDAAALRRVVVEAKPTHVIHQLTALPKGGPKSARDLEPTNRLRNDGTRNLIEAAVAAGAARIVVGSFALFARRPDRADACRDAPRRGGSAIDGITDARGQPRRPDRRRRPALRALLRTRDTVDDRDDRDGEAPDAAGNPRRPWPAPVHPRGRCGRGDRARARPRAGRQRLRHRR